MITTFASFPSSRREGPSNVFSTDDRVTLPTGVDTVILPEDLARASFIMRNESLTDNMVYYSELGGHEEGQTLFAGESVTLANVKNIVYGRSIGGAPVEVSLVVTRS